MTENFYLDNPDIQFQLEKRAEFIEPDVEIEHDAYRSFGRSKRQHLEDPEI